MENKKIASQITTQHPRGITLVALVVTIIVLLILAGVTITAVLGDNGIIKKAGEVANKMKEAADNEQKELDNLINELDSILGGSGAGSGGATISKGQLVTGRNSTYTDATGTATIPVGFCVVKDSVENPNDTNTVESGLVISDVAEDDLDNSKHGNQFVWIPVDYNNFHLIEGYANGSLQAYLSKESNPSREAGASKTEIMPGKPNVANSVLGTDESVAMYKSVKDNGGFYIARFEAGIDGTTASTTTNDTNKQTQDGTVKPVSQKGVGVWNYIPWGGTTAVEASDNLPGNDNANGAVKVARSMYTKSSTCGVNSTLCYGVQWDAALNFIDPNYVSGTSTGFVKDSTNMGNYSGSIATAGSNTAYQQKHVYDLAGNVREWIMEAYSTNYRVTRGGFYHSTSGSSYPASQRNNGLPNDSSNGIGFRLALYL